jgi:diguanylate cyclase (GGDEF)-like protein
VDEAARRGRYKAAWLRFGFGVLAIIVLPPWGVDPLAVYSACGLYAFAAVAQQIMLLRGLGDRWRPWIGGLADVGLLTFFVHRLGSTSTPVISLYILIPVAYAILGLTRLATALAILGVTAYGGVLFAELAGVLPVDADRPLWIETSARPLVPVIGWILTAAAIVGMSTLFAVRVAQTLARREADLLDANKQLELMSRKDPLTHLANRRHLMDRLDQELARAKRDHPAAVLMVDLDGFKRVNDDLGHLAGDDALKDIANALATVTRATDLAGRFGGDEFLLLLTDANPDAVTTVGDRLCTAIRDAGRVDDRHHVTASIGIAIVQAGDTQQTVIARADANTYAAKQAGGDRHVGP